MNIDGFIISRKFNYLLENGNPEPFKLLDSAYASP